MKRSLMKKILHSRTDAARHWVGDGFPVRSLLTYQDHAELASPFLLLDYAGPAEFEATELRRGVGPHPHRGFETVTIVYQGEVAHHDTTGQGGHIGPGDVQWMTAGAGIVHQEYHSDSFASTGGTLEMVQLWVNLPARDKMVEPGYQAILSTEIPTVTLPDDVGSVRLIAGEYNGHFGPARSHTPMNVWDIRLKAGRSTTLTLPEGWSVSLLTLRGPVLINDTAISRDGELTVLGRDGSEITLEANSDATLLLLSGEPINEPVVGHGPFVMNTSAEIQQAISDYQSGSLWSDQPLTSPENRANTAEVNHEQVIQASRPNGSLVPELKEMFPDAPYIARPGQINAWENADFVKAVKATGKKQLIVAGVVTEVCVAFPVLSALAEEFEVFVVTDASGTFNEVTRDAAWDRMSQGGAQLMSWFGVACELHRDWRNDIEGLGALFSNHIPDYRNLINSYARQNLAA